MKFVYKNDNAILDWNLDLEIQIELENRELEPDQRHVIFECDDKRFFRWYLGAVIQKTRDELIQDELIPLQELKDEQTEKVNQICESKIISGFISNSLGSDHFYQSDRDDQTNLIGATTSQTEAYFKCNPIIDGIKQSSQYILHSHDQLELVLNHGKVKMTDYLMNAFNLKNQIANATTQAGLFAIDINSGW